MSVRRSTPEPRPAAAPGSAGRWALRLPALAGSPGAARELVADACAAWGLPSLLHPGRAVVSELVANAVEHAGTDLEVVVSRRPAALHLAVRDGSPRLPRLRAVAARLPGRPLDERGQGLRLVAADSVAWGTVPFGGGKVVWAVVGDPPP